ncbi:biotin/lipoate--protein ligase family protein [Methylobacterium sp. 77]|uniref:biotin/lipoate--protein ligase family protein n=1 Tax=Methylobacterium sp. 77 TaxID=1101192 RepID=UPI00036FA812|nr:biotin/lipoate--protein ligase family protein [Methylobacterium sp. 77]
MAPSPDDTAPPKLALPPVFSLLVSAGPTSAFDAACRHASSGEATGLLVWRRDAAILDLAVILAPDEPLATARRAFFAGIVALAEAIGAHGPPEIPVTFDWPDTVRFDGARLGGGRLGWPATCGEGDVPDWLVFSTMIIASKAQAGDPGLTPDSTSLANEGFAQDDDHASVVESFARHLMKAFALWEEDGFEAIERRYLSRLVDGGRSARIDRNGDLIDDDGTRRSLVSGLAGMSWRDPLTDEPLL